MYGIYECTFLGKYLRYTSWRGPSNYGPMIQVIGTEGEQDLNIHFGWNSTIKPNKGGYLIGTVVALGV